MPLLFMLGGSQIDDDACHCEEACDPFPCMLVWDIT